MKIYKLSLGTSFFDDSLFAKLTANNLVSLHPNTSAKGQSSVSQGDAFLTAKKGDLFYVCRSNDSVSFIGMFNDEMPLYSQVPGHNDWVDRSYSLLASASNPERYNKGLDKWWSPKNNSTFIEITQGDLALFEEAILRPAFDLSISDISKKRDDEFERGAKDLKDYKELQLYFQQLEENEQFLFDEMNKLTALELHKLFYTYQRRGDISQQPVVTLRKEILKRRLEGVLLTAKVIDNVKEELNLNYEKNVYHAWKSNFRILYTFLYEKDKNELESYFKALIKKLQIDLGIQSITKSRLVHLDGAQNQGNDRIWLAIYNSSHRSQKFAKQLFFELGPKDKCGLLSHKDSLLNDVDHNVGYNYDSILERLKMFKSEIVNDDSMINKELEDYSEILEYKKQLILQGPPGTGKTFKAKALANFLIRGQDQFDEVISENKIRNTIIPGVKLRSASGKEDYYTVKEVTENGVTIHSEKSQNWTASFKKIIDKYNTLVKKEKPSNLNNKDPYEIAVAKYLFDHSKQTSKQVEVIQFHPSYSYEDFVRGIEVENINGKIAYRSVNKIFGDIVHRAQTNFEKYAGSGNEIRDENRFKKYILIIDEINRANLPSVLGELIYGLEYRGETVQSMYTIDGEKGLSIPENLYIIGTMNTADRSVGHIDYAIRRRFAFVPILPNVNVIENDKAKTLFAKVSSLFKEVNNEVTKNAKYLAPDFDYKDVQIGHSYFMLKEKSDLSPEDELQLRLDYEIKPILYEYVKDGVLLESAIKEIDKLTIG